MLDDLLTTAELAARSAGAEAMRWLERGIRAHDKRDREWVTEGDVAAQRSALKVIKARYPDHAILAEEEGLAGGPDEHGVWVIPDGVTWIIDPVDGTTNYARQVPLFCVSVGVAIDGEPVVGVILDPIHDQLFSAARGRGAVCNGRRLEVGRKDMLADAVVGFDSPTEPEYRRKQWSMLPQLSSNCRTIRRFGVAALGMAYVAAGILDVYLHVNLHPWDVAAGALLVQEAGGDVRQMNGAAWRLGYPSVVMGDPQLLDSVTALVARSQG